MCLSPVLIDNPNFNSPVKDPTFTQIHNVKDSKIPVPCGRCAACIHLRQMYYVQRVQMESLDNDLFFGTLTYNQDSLPIAEFDDIKFAYPDVTDWQKMIKMIRKDYPDLKFKYMLVSEYGSKKHRPHFHFILSLPKTEDVLAVKIGRAHDLFHVFLRYWRRNYGTTFKPVWKSLCTYKNNGKKYNYDLHYLDPNSSKDGLDGVSFYVTKYIVKYDDWVDKFKSKLYYNLSHDDYLAALKLLIPRRLLSIGFGSPGSPSVKAHIRKGIELSKKDENAIVPYFFHSISGASSPLAPYYQKKFLTISDKLVFANRLDKIDISQIDYYAADDYDKSQFKLMQIRAFLNAQSLEIDFDDICDINEQLLDYGMDQNPFLQDDDLSPNWEDF